MRQDVDGVMTTAEARERGYLPTAEVPALIGVKRELRGLGKTMRRARACRARLLVACRRRGGVGSAAALDTSPRCPRRPVCGPWL